MQTNTHNLPPTGGIYGVLVLYIFETNLFSLTGNLTRTPDHLYTYKRTCHTFTNRATKIVEYIVGISGM